MLQMHAGAGTSVPPKAATPDRTQEAGVALDGFPSLLFLPWGPHPPLQPQLFPCIRLSLRLHTKSDFHPTANMCVVLITVLGERSGW